MKVVLTKNKTVLNEYYSVYNAIEFLQRELVGKPVLKKHKRDYVTFLIGTDKYRVDVFTERQQSAVVNWVTGFSRDIIGKADETHTN